MNINKLCIRYIVEVAIIVVVLGAIGIAVEKTTGRPLFGQQAVSTVYLLVVELLAIAVWRWIVKNHSDMLPSFFTALSGVRFLGALLMMLIWYLMVGSAGVMAFLVVFAVYYFVMLIHQSIFFSRVSNRL